MEPPAGPEENEDTGCDPSQFGEVQAVESADAAATGDFFLDG